jgi:Ca-activated chloride channel family protein
VLDKEYSLTSDDYTMEDFIENLKKKGYLREEIEPDGKIVYYSRLVVKTII